MHYACILHLASSSLLKVPCTSPDIGWRSTILFVYFMYMCMTCIQGIISIDRIRIYEELTGTTGYFHEKSTKCSCNKCHLANAFTCICAGIQSSCKTSHKVNTWTIPVDNIHASEIYIFSWHSHLLNSVYYMYTCMVFPVFWFKTNIFDQFAGQITQMCTDNWLLSLQSDRLVWPASNGCPLMGIYTFKCFCSWGALLNLTLTCQLFDFPLISQ